MSRHRLVALFGAGLLLAGIVAGPVAAAKPGTESFSFSEAGLTAQAFTGDCVDNGDGSVTCSGEGIFAFAGKVHERGSGAARFRQVCVNFFEDTFNEETGEGSFTFEDGCEPAAVTFNNLSTATIPSTTVTVTGETCTFVDPETEADCTPSAPREVVVQGTFTGTGPTVRTSHRSFYDDGVCVQRDSSSGYERSATFSGTLDGSPFTPAEAWLRDGKFSFSSTCTVPTE